MLNVNIVIREPLPFIRIAFRVCGNQLFMSYHAHGIWSNIRARHTRKRIPRTHIRTHAHIHVTHTYAYMYTHEFGTYYAVKYLHVDLYTNREWSTLEEKWHHRSIGSHAHAIGAHMLKNVYTNNWNQNLYIELCTIVLQLARRISNRRSIECQHDVTIKSSRSSSPRFFFFPKFERNSARNLEINILKFINLFFFTFWAPKMFISCNPYVNTWYNNTLKYKQ